MFMLRSGRQASRERWQITDALESTTCTNGDTRASSSSVGSCSRFRGDRMMETRAVERMYDDVIMIV